MTNRWGMAGDWRVRKLGELVEIFDGPHATPKKTRSGPVFLGISNLSQGRIDLSSSKHLSEEDFQRWTRRVTPSAGDVVFSYETRLGEAALVPDGLRCCLGRRMGLLRPRSGLIDSRFLLYAYLGPDFQETIRERTVHGSTVDRIPLVDMPEFPIRVPAPQTQKQIGYILGALDDKIELNRRMNETLEAMARALFKSWFVDFDPVRAKAQGQTPSGMDPTTAALFPSELQDSPLGEIPKGWRASTLNDQTTKIGSGATPRGGKSTYVEHGIALIRSQNVYDSQFVWNGLARITDAAGSKLVGVTVERDDILLNITGASILRTCVVVPDVLPARVNQHVAIVRAKPGVPPRYLHFHLLNPRTKDYLMGMDAGASRQAVTKGHIESVPIVVPSEAVLTRFDELVRPMFLTVDLNNAQSRRLAEARNALLPRLLSGDLSVDQAEYAVEATA